MREQMLLDRTAVLKSLVLCEISTYPTYRFSRRIPGVASTGTMRRYSEGFSSQARAVSLYNSSTRPHPRRATPRGRAVPARRVVFDRITPKANQRANLYPTKIRIVS